MSWLSHIKAAFAEWKESLTVQTVEPATFARTAPTPYKGRAKFRFRVKEGDGLDCFQTRDVRADELVVQLPATAWKVRPEIAGHAIATQIGNVSRRKESTLGRAKWG